MTYKSKVTNVESNEGNITITYDILDHTDSVVANNQTLVINDPNDMTNTAVRARLLDKAKKMQTAADIATTWQAYINQVFTVNGA